MFSKPRVFKKFFVLIMKPFAARDVKNFEEIVFSTHPTVYTDIFATCDWKISVVYVRDLGDQELKIKMINNKKNRQETF